MRCLQTFVHFCGCQRRSRQSLPPPIGEIGPQEREPGRTEHERAQEPVDWPEGGRAHADRLPPDTCVTALEESNSPGPESALALEARVWTAESESECVFCPAVASPWRLPPCRRRARERVPTAVRGSELFGVVRGEGATAASLLVWPQHFVSPPSNFLPYRRVNLRV